ncbi:MAG: CorA family divalent cation transporter [Thermomicrobium sp.]|nr:CorA family divalent cation transporter [Thermomicrobium sp.]
MGDGQGTPPARSFLALPRLRLAKQRQQPGTWGLTAADEARSEQLQELAVRLFPGPNELRTLPEVDAALETGTARWIDIRSPDASAAAYLRRELALGALPLEHLLSPARMPQLDLLPDGGVVALLFLLHLAEGTGPRLQASPVGFLIRPTYLHDDALRADRAAGTTPHGVPRDRGGPSGARAEIAARAIDAPVDEHLAVMLRTAELAEELEERLDPENEQDSLAALGQLIVLRRDLLVARRLGVTQQELIRRIARAFPEEAASFEDCAASQREAIESATAVCDDIDGAIEAYRLRRETRTEIGIRRLTVLASLFGVVSIVMGLWGVNFVEIPGAESHWGWFAFVGAIALVFALSIWYVRRRGLR